jgi:hypothetical protein
VDRDLQSRADEEDGERLLLDSAVGDMLGVGGPVA